VLFLGADGAAVVRLDRVDPGVACGLAARTFHTGLDWGWEMPAVTLHVQLLADASIAWTHQKREAGRGMHANAGDLQTRPSAAEQ
jgi:hypothetical protein